MSTQSTPSIPSQDCSSRFYFQKPGSKKVASICSKHFSRMSDSTYNIQGIPSIIACHISNNTPLSTRVSNADQHVQALFSALEQGDYLAAEEHLDPKLYRLDFRTTLRALRLLANKVEQNNLAVIKKLLDSAQKLSLGKRHSTTLAEESEQLIRNTLLAADGEDMSRLSDLTNQVARQNLHPALMLRSLQKALENRNAAKASISLNYWLACYITSHQTSTRPSLTIDRAVVSTPSSISVPTPSTSQATISRVLTIDDAPPRKRAKIENAHVPPFLPSSSPLASCSSSVAAPSTSEARAIAPEQQRLGLRLTDPNAARLNREESFLAAVGTGNVITVERLIREDRDSQCKMSAAARLKAITTAVRQGNGAMLVPLLRREVKDYSSDDSQLENDDLFPLMFDLAIENDSNRLLDVFLGSPYGNPYTFSPRLFSSTFLMQKIMKIYPNHREAALRFIKSKFFFIEASKNQSQTANQFLDFLESIKEEEMLDILAQKMNPACLPYINSLAFYRMSLQSIPKPHTRWDFNTLLLKTAKSLDQTKIQSLIELRDKEFDRKTLTVALKHLIKSTDPRKYGALEALLKTNLNLTMKSTKKLLDSIKEDRRARYLFKPYCERVLKMTVPD